jgi:UDP-glucose 4-epimerase
VIAAFRPTALVHLAALTSVPESFERPEENDRLNYEGTKLIAGSCLRGNVTRIVYSSSAAVYGTTEEMPLREEVPCEPLSPYGRAKLASEEFLLSLASRGALTVRCHRYFNVYGPRQDPKSPYSGVISLFADAVRAGVAPTIFGDGLQSRDFISVHDVARANVIAATAPTVRSGVANICTGSAVTLNQLLSVIQRFSGTSLRPNYQAPRIGDIRHSCGAPDRARDQLGFTAAISLEDGIAELIGGKPLPSPSPQRPDSGGAGRLTRACGASSRASRP